MGPWKDSVLLYQSRLPSKVSRTQNILKSILHPAGEYMQEIPTLTFKLFKRF